MAAPPKSEVKAFLIKVAAVTIAALAILYAAKSWFFTGRGTAQGAISWQQAAKHVGEFATVEGTVVETRNTGKACFLNFHPDWQHSFTAVIFASRFDRFPSKPEEHYRGRKVRVTGYIKEYEGKPEIILESPKQIEMVN